MVNEHSGSGKSPFRITEAKNGYRMQRPFLKHKNLHRLLLCVVALLFSCQLAAPAFAAGCAFSDVPPGSQWHESVEYLVGQGVSLGTGNSCYSPDAPITVRQWAVMVCRAQKTEVLQEKPEQFGMSCVQYGVQEGWLEPTAAERPDLPMCRGALYHSAFHAFDIPVYDGSLFSDGPACSDWDNALRVGRELDLCEENGTALEIVIRGETASLLFGLMTKSHTPQEPPLLSMLTIQNTDGLPVGNFLLELRRVPEPILHVFRDNGWVYAIDCGYLAQLGKRLDMNCIGAANYATRYIYVAQAGATVHEFGHFLDQVLDFPAEHKHLHLVEGTAAASLIRDYSNTNSREFFADCFAYWIRNRDNAQRMSAFKAAMPETCAYFEELESRSWCKK